MIEAFTEKRALRYAEFRVPEVFDSTGDMPGLHAPGWPGELGGTRRIAADAVACVAARCRLPGYGAVALLARRLAVSKAQLREFTEEGIAVPALRSAMLDAVEEVEGRAGGPWAGHVPACLRTVINSEGA